MSNNSTMRDYVIRILHEKPEKGKGVEFVATYYAKEDKNQEVIKEIFTKAFNTAHPSWNIKKVTIEEKR